MASDIALEDGAAPLEAVGAFENYIAPARARPQVWRILLGILLICVSWIGIAVITFAGVVGVRIAVHGDSLGDALRYLQTVQTMSSSSGVFVALVSFVGVWAGVALAVFALHRRGLRSVLAAKGRPLLSGFWLGAGVALLLTLVPLLVTAPFGGLPERSDLALNDWLVMLAPLAVLVLVQAGAEELIFRGYLLQQLAARFRSPLVWGLLPSFLFGMMHFWNPEIGLADSILYVAATTLFGIAAAGMVHQTGGLGAAMGFHVTVNFTVLSLFGMAEVQDGVSLFSAPQSNSTAGFVVDVAIMALFAALVHSRWSPFRTRERRVG